MPAPLSYRLILHACLTDQPHPSLSLPCPHPTHRNRPRAAPPARRLPGSRRKRPVVPRPACRLFQKGAFPTPLVRNPCARHRPCCDHWGPPRHMASSAAAAATAPPPRSPPGWRLPRGPPQPAGSFDPGEAAAAPIPPPVARNGAAPRVGAPQEALPMWMRLLRRGCYPGQSPTPCSLAESWGRWPCGACPAASPLLLLPQAALGLLRQPLSAT